MMYRISGMTSKDLWWMKPRYDGLQQLIYQIYLRSLKIWNETVIIFTRIQHGCKYTQEISKLPIKIDSESSKRRMMPYKKVVKNHGVSLNILLKYKRSDLNMHAIEGILIDLVLIAKRQIRFTVIVLE